MNVSTELQLWPRIKAVFDRSPWLVLALNVVGAVIVAFGMLALDRALMIEPPESRSWLYGGTAESALSLLSAIASSSITVAGVVFSATIVTMQLASSQYSPRVIEPLSRRWNVQIVLGVFLGSFTYSILVLRAVRPAQEGSEEWVPILAVSFAVIYALVAVGVMLYYTAYAMRSLQPTFLIDSAAHETVDVLRARVSGLRSIAHGSSATEQSQIVGEPLVLNVETPGFVQRIQVRELMHIARQNDLVVRIDQEVGVYALRGEPIVSVWPAASCSAEVQSALLEMVSFGPERTAEQDIEYGIRRVADIMLKALSPAVNDPTTAEYAFNRLCELIILLASTDQHPESIADENGSIRLIWESQSFERCVRTAFGQLRFYVHTDVHLMLYALDMLERSTRLVPPELRAPVLREAANLRTSGLESVHIPADRQAIIDASAWIGAESGTPMQS